MQPVAGIAHEALLTHWPRLKDLLEKDREFLRARTPRRRRRRALAAGEPPRRFPAPRGQAARRGRASCSTPAATTSTPRRSNSSTSRFAYRTRQRRRRTRAIATITGIVLSVVSAFAAFSFVEWRDALESEARVADRVRSAIADTQRNKATEQEKKALSPAGSRPAAPPTSRT